MLLTSSVTSFPYPVELTAILLARATNKAVSSLSPVRIHVLIPASLILLMILGTSSYSGSSIAAMPRNSKSVSYLSYIWYSYFWSVELVIFFRSSLNC